MKALPLAGLSVFNLMRYKKGTFLQAPNKHILKGKSPYLQIVFIWLCEHGDQNGYCFPSAQRLADDSGISRWKVFKVLKELESLGIIERKGRKDGKEQLSNGYYLIDKGGSAPDTLPSVQDTQPPSVQDTHELTPLFLTDPINYSEVKINEEGEEVKERKGGKRDLSGWGEFRDLYPRKENMLAASAEWGRLSKKERDSILADLPKRNLTDQWEKNDGQFVPLAVNYLKNKRWLDPIAKRRSKLYVV